MTEPTNDSDDGVIGKVAEKAEAAVSKLTVEVPEFLGMQSAGGILLMVAALAAVVLANTPLVDWYDLLITTHVVMKIGDLGVDKALLLWINDGLMAVFFLLVGLELKRELLEGELSDARRVAMPLIGAVGGMLVPSLIYLALNHEDAVARHGWAISAPTDIAFALGVLYLIGDRVPASARIFLTSLAIFDDIGAIVIIALFYTENVAVAPLMVVLGCLPVLAFMQWRRVDTISPYAIVGTVMWIAMLKSGVHATLVGVIVAMFVPITPGRGGRSLLKRLELDLHGGVTYLILPLFAFANSCRAGWPVAWGWPRCPAAWMPASCSAWQPCAVSDSP